MKKIFYLIILSILTLTILGCEQNNVLEDEDEIKLKPALKLKKEIRIPIGLYKYYGKNSPRKLIKTYKEKWQYHQDISSFEVYYTKEDEISGIKQQDLFTEYKNNYQNIDNYKIGYQIIFSTKDENFKETILRPRDTERIFPYLEIYLYDDYHHLNGWYSDTTEDDYDDNTILTSIKLTAGKKIDLITSNITVKAFLYLDSEINAHYEYHGFNYYSLTVLKN